MRKKQIRKMISFLYERLENVPGAVELIDEVAELVEQEISDDENKIESIAESSTTKFPLPKEVEGIDDSYAIFSDGACRGNPGPGSWGVMAQNSDGEVLFTSSGVEMLTTNNQMELEGAYQGLQQLMNLDYFSPEDKVKLYSDSKYVVDGIQKWVTGWINRGWKKADGKVPENVQQWKKLSDLNSTFKNIEYIWVKGHSGHPQNEYCDQLANQALDESGF